MPFEGDWMVDTLDGRFPDKVMLKMDEGRFQSGFQKYAIWADGKGNYASLAYCGDGLTIMRHVTLAEAIQAKRTIDNSGCGGGCAKVHMIVQIDPSNSRQARQMENVRRHRSKEAEAHE
jgi:hypothetical protein